MASLTTDKLRQLLLQAASGSPALDLGANTIKVMLLGTGYTPSKAHAFISDLGANELSGTGYTAGFGGSGRKTLSGKTTNVSSNKAIFDANDVTWTAINSGTIGHIAVVKEVTSDADSPVLAIISLASSQATNGGDITAQWGADGLFYIISP